MELTQIKKVQSTKDQHNNDFDKHVAMASERNDDKEVHSHENASKDSLHMTSKKKDIKDHEAILAAKKDFVDGTNKDVKKVEDEDNAEGPTKHCNRYLVRSGDAFREQKNDIKEQPCQEDQEHMTKKGNGTFDSQRFMSVQKNNVDVITRKDKELESPESKGEGDALEGYVGFGSLGTIGTHRDEDSGTGGLGNDQQLQENTDKGDKKCVTASQDHVVNGTNRMGEEQIPQKTGDKDNVIKHTDSGSQKNVHAGNDAASTSPGDNANVESVFEYDNDDLMKFTVILSGNHTISAPQGEEAVKWRFLFDCPYTRKEICEDPIMLGTSLEYRKETSPLIHWKKSDRTVKEGVEELLQKHAKQVQICNTVISNESVKIFLETQELVELFQNKMVIAYKTETNLYICGKKEHMEEAVRHVNNTKDYALGLISKTEKISLKDIPLQLIKRWMEVHMSPDTSDIHYEFREDQKSLHITGLEREIIKVKDNLLNLFENITRMTYKSRLCVAHCSVFEQSGVVKYIEGILQEQKLVCTWETNKADCIIVVTAFDKETCEMSCKVIDAACVTEDISLQLDAVTKIIPSDSWEQELSSLCTRFEGKMKMWFDQEKNILEYIYTPDIKEMVRNEVQGLINSWDREKHMLIEKQVAEKLENEQQKLRKLEKCYSVIISVSRKIEKIGFLIVGKDINIQPALEELGKECSVILKAQSKPATSWPSLENCECICVPETNEAELIMLKDKCLLKSNKNNQAELKDAEMDTEIAEITPVFSLKVSRSDEVEADMVLPADKSKRPVIFFCPDWNEGQSKEKHVLDTVLCHLFEFLSSLDGYALLEIEGKKIGNWPVMEFIKLMLVTYKKFLDANPATKMSRLFLVMKDEEVYGIVSAAVSDVYSANKSYTEDKMVSSPEAEARVMSKASQISCGIKALEVFVVNDQLTHRKEDVLVNTADPELKLRFGFVSRSIYDAAGEGIRMECKKRYPNGIKPGQVAVTGAFGLKESKLIFHGTFEKWNTKMEKKLKHTLKDFVAQCLQKADKAKMNSIAFPAIGTGILNYPSMVVADCMFEAVEEYTQTKPAFLHKVYFVIYDKDKENVEAFGKRKKLYDNKIEGSPVGQESTFPSGGAKSKRKPTEQQNHSMVKNIVPSSIGQKWMGHFTKIFKVLIYVGDITDSQCKAIVSSDDKQLKSNGVLENAILMKGGKDFQMHIDNDRDSDYEVGDVLEIDAGKMKCKVICCIVPKWNSSMSDEKYKRHLGQCFRNILEKARAYESVAMPLIGIGFKDDSITICGRILLDCLLKFSEAHRVKEAIREVHIVSPDDGAIACVESIFMEHFDAEKKRLDAESRNSAYQDDVSATASGGHDQSSQNVHVPSREMRQVSKPGEHNNGRGEAEMDIIENLESYNNESIHPPGAQTMNRSEDDKQDQCVICLDTFEMPVMMKKCGHMFCKGCIDIHLKNKPLCPVCGTIYGIITGNQPKGRMTESVHKDFHLDGYEECGMITITYDIPDGIQKKDHPKPGQCYFGLKRKAYLPNNKKGQKVLRLLHLAFDRRLIFTIGRSVTTGQDDMVTWNDIHHKTNMFGGPQSYGYPDQKYLDRVLEELAAKGVTEESEHQVPGNFSDYYKLTPVKESTV